LSQIRPEFVDQAPFVLHTERLNFRKSFEKHDGQVTLEFSRSQSAKLDVPSPLRYPHPNAQDGVNETFCRRIV
jgi:hypothetical protein